MAAPIQQLEDMEEEKGRNGRGKTPDRLDPGQGNKGERRGSSHLLAAAGIDLERRRRLSNQDGRVLQEGNKVLFEDKDGNITKLEVVEVREKMGLLRKAVPTLPIFIAIILCLINICLPGIGSLIGAASLLCCGKCRHERVSEGIKYGVIAGLLQLVTAIFIIGWIYSIYYGVNMVQDAITKAAINPEGQDGNATDEEKNKPPPNGSKPTQAWS